MSEKPTYGQMLVETGKFAKAITETETFIKWWPNGEPLWSMAGVAWAGNSDRGMDRPAGLTEEDVIYEEEFDEGRQRLRQHFIRERSTSVVRVAKEQWRKSIRVGRNSNPSTQFRMGIKRILY